MTPTPPPCPLASPNPDPRPRRSFLTKAVALVSAGLAFLIPSTLAVLYTLTPLFRKKSAGSESEAFRFVGKTGGLTPGGPPQLFQVFGSKQDGWTTYSRVALGSVLVQLNPEGEVTCFNARCPHLGCTIGYQASREEYYCPCHAGSFKLNGDRQNHVPPRNMDRLDAEIRNGNELWVKFQNYRNGAEEQIPV